MQASFNCARYVHTSCFRRDEGRSGVCEAQRQNAYLLSRWTITNLCEHDAAPRFLLQSGSGAGLLDGSQLERAR